MQTPRQKRRDEHKGFDLLEAIYAEKGLISGGSSSLISAKAIGGTRAHSERHHQEKEKRHRAPFTENPRTHARSAQVSWSPAVKKRGRNKPSSRSS